MNLLSTFLLMGVSLVILGVISVTLLFAAETIRRRGSRAWALALLYAGTPAVFLGYLAVCTHTGFPTLFAVQ